MRYVLFLSLALLTLGTPLSASTFVAMAPDELVAGSAAIVEGEVLHVESYWDAEHKIIITEAKVRVQDLVFGEAPSVVRVKTFGGTVDGYTIEAIGFPTFEAGQRVFVFLEEDRDPDMMRVAGYQQGLFRVRTEQSGALTAVSALDEGAHLVHPIGRVKRLPSTLPLGELKRQVRLEASRLRQDVEN